MLYGLSQVYIEPSIVINIALWRSLLMLFAACNIAWQNVFAQTETRNL
jgi:hypothetical protein